MDSPGCTVFKNVMFLKIFKIILFDTISFHNVPIFSHSLRLKINQAKNKIARTELLDSGTKWLPITWQRMKQENRRMHHFI